MNKLEQSKKFSVHPLLMMSCSNIMELEKTYFLPIARCSATIEKGSRTVHLTEVIGYENFYKRKIRDSSDVGSGATGSQSIYFCGFHRSATGNFCEVFRDDYFYSEQRRLFEKSDGKKRWLSTG